VKGVFRWTDAGQIATKTLKNKNYFHRTVFERIVFLFE
jgi:hypothetical protein